MMEKSKLLNILGILSILLALIGQVRSTSIATGNYYLDTPLPIAAAYVGKYSNGTYFAINGTNWQNFIRSTNASDVIQQSLDFAYNNGGGSVLIGEQTFVLDSKLTVKQGVSLIGQGPDATILQWSGSKTGNMIEITDGYANIERLKVDGANKNVRGVAFTQSISEVFSWIRDVRVMRCNNSAIYITGWWTLVDHCWIQTNNNDGIVVNITSGYWAVIQNTLIKMNAGHNFRQVQNDGHGPTILDNCNIEFAGREQNGSDNDRWGVYVEKHPIHMINCEAENNSGDQEQAVWIGTTSADSDNSRIITCSGIGNVTIDNADRTILRDVTLREGCSLTITSNATYTYVENVIRADGTVDLTNNGSNTSLEGWNSP